MSFQIVRVKKFPDLQVNEIISTNEELNIRGFGRDANTSIKLINTDYNSFKYYEIHHEFKLNESGIAFVFNDNGLMEEKQFSSYLKTTSLHGYYDDLEKLFYIEGVSPVIKSFLKCMNNNISSTGIEFEVIEIDLDQLIKIAPDVEAAWLRGESSNLKAIGFYGNNVCGAREYENLHESKQLSSIIIAPVVRNVIRRIQINSTTCFYIADRIDDHDELLNIVKEFKNKYIRRLISAEDTVNA